MVSEGSFKADLVRDRVERASVGNSQKSLTTAIYFIADLHSALESEFQKFLSADAPRTPFAQHIFDLQGFRLEMYKRKLGKVSRFLAMSHPTLLEMLTEAGRDLCTQSANNTISYEQIANAVHSVQLAVTTLGLFCVSGAMANSSRCDPRHPNNPVSKVMANDSRGKQCHQTVSALQALLSILEELYPDETAEALPAAGEVLY